MNLPSYLETKPSGFKGLGNLPRHWEVIRGRFVMRVNPSAPRLRNLKPEDEVSFVPMEAVGEYGGLNLEQTRVIADVSSGYTEFQDGDVVVAKITPCFENGKAGLAHGLLNGAAYGTTELHVLRAGPTLDRGFLFYVAISDRFRKLGESEMYGAGGQKRVPPEFNKDFPMPVPPAAEQQQIAAFLDWKTCQIDALIARKKELLEKLKEKRIAVITQAVTQGLNPAAPMRDSGIPWFGQVPQHWIVKRLRYCAGLVTSGSRGWAQHFSDFGELFLRITNLDRESIELLLEDLQRVEPPDGAEGAITLTKAGDLLISITADLGSVAVIPSGLEPAYVSQHLSLVRLDTIAIDPNWIAYSIFSHAGKFQLRMAGYGGTKVQLSLGDIKEIGFCHPPTLEEQHEILHFIRAKTKQTEDLIDLTSQAIDRLNEYRTALITAATTGKIDVRNVNRPTQGQP